MNIFSSIRLFSRDSASVADRVLLLPGHLFFTESIELTAEIAPAEWQSVAELTLESLTPFSMEQLIWGYGVCRRSRTLTVFAAYRERVKQAGYDNLEAYHQVYPEFLVLDASSREKATVSLIHRGESVTAAGFAPHARIPDRVVSAPVPEEAELQETFDSVVAEFPDDRYELAETWSGDVESEIGQDGAIHFRMEGKTISTVSGALLWSADLREIAFGLAKKRERQRDVILWKILLAAAGLAAALLAVEVLRGAGNIWIHFREKQIQRQAPVVAQIMSRSNRVNRLEQRATGRLRPFDTLDLLNRDRPATLYFTAVEADEFNRYVIEGIAGTVNELNAYAAALAESGYFESVVPQINKTQSGQTTFTLQLIVRELPATTEVAQP